MRSARPARSVSTRTQTGGASGSPRFSSTKLDDTGVPRVVGAVLGASDFCSPASGRRRLWRYRTARRVRSLATTDVNGGQKPPKSGAAENSGRKIAGPEPGQGRAPARRSNPLTRRRDGYAGAWLQARQFRAYSHADLRFSAPDCRGFSPPLTATPETVSVNASTVVRRHQRAGRGRGAAKPRGAPRAAG